MLAFDTEATGLDHYAPDFKVFMIQWCGASGEQVCDESQGDTWAQPFLDAIAEEEVLVAANASYDIHALYASGIVDLLSGQWRVHDVLTLARVAVPGRFQYKLEGLGDDLLGADSTVAQRALKEAAKRHKIPWTLKNKDYYALWKAEPRLMEQYGMEDVRLAYDLFELIWNRASVTDSQVYDMEIKGVAPILRAAERDGVLVDKERLAALKARLIAERDELRCQLVAQGLTEEALGWEATDEAEAGKASAKALLADLLRIGIPLYRKTPKSGEINQKTGKRTPDQLAVNKDVLKEFKLRFPVVGDLLKWRAACKVLSTYVSALELADPRIHTSFSQAEARTGRMSASKPNVQNLPTVEEEREGQQRRVGVRDVLIPGPGNAFIVGDYKNIEVFMLAHYIADAELIAMLESGVDLYAMTAARVEQKRGNMLTYEECGKDGPNAALRQKAKTTALTAMYGGGARLLGVRLNIPTSDAADIKRETLDAIPGYWDLDARVKAAVRRRRFPHVVTLLGRRLYVPKDYVALNTLLQGSSAEIMKLGMIAAAPAIAKFGYAVRLVVHDELVAEGPACHAPAALVALKAAMESVYPLKPRLMVSGDWSTDSYGAAK